MIMRLFILIVVLFCTTVISVAADKPPQDANPPATTHEQSSRVDSKAVKTDLERMRALLGQMQRNVAFVTPGDTPLKHQLQLEIDMWQLLLNDMEKRSNAQLSQ